MNKTAISWTEGTWNPVTGCDRVSEGCDHCYALALAARLKAAGNPRYRRDGGPRSGPGFGLTVHWDKIAEPLRWRQPRTVFVNSMSDLFHPEVPEEALAAIIEVMARTPQHRYQVLTKRPRRMRSVLTRLQPDPLPNVWWGTSVESQRWAEVRIPELLATPATIRFLSCEPLLGPLDLRPWLEHLDWVIVGGESGPHLAGADPSHPRWMRMDWARSVRDQCVEAGVPFFFKQDSGPRTELRPWIVEPDGSRTVWQQMPAAP